MLHRLAGTRRNLRWNVRLRQFARRVLRVVINVGTLHDPDYHLKEVTHDSVAYYLREGEAPGRWAGTGATAMGLRGEVTSGPIHDLFDGKHPNTGEYLIPSKGSNGRARDRRGDRVVDVRAAAGQLGIRPERVRVLLSRGTLAGTKTAGGHWEVPQPAIDAFRQGGPQPCTGPRNLKAAADATVSMAQAAQMAGVSARYLRKIAVTEAPPAPADDSPVGQYLVATKAGNAWRVLVDAVARFIGARTPARVVEAYDLAVRAPKSVSLLHALGEFVPADAVARCGLARGETVTGVVLACHQEAVQDVVTFLEGHAAFVRGPGGRVPATGLIAAVWDHRAARDGAPLLHSHITIVNTAVGTDGRRAALDGTALYAWARASGHVYQASLRRRMIERLGVEWDQPHNGTADLAGVPRQSIVAFSQRRREALEFMARLGLEGPKALAAAVLATRDAKNSVEQGRSPAVVLAQAERHGLGVEQLGRLVGHGPRRRMDPQRLGQIAADLASPAGLTEKSSVVDLRDAICGFANAMVDGATPADLERWSTRLLHDPKRFVPVAGSSPRSGAIIQRADGTVVRSGGVAGGFTTAELLAHEAQLLQAHVRGWGPDGAGIGAGVADKVALEAAIAAVPSLRAEQRDMVERLCSSGIGLEVVHGGPGTGKTFALGVAAQAWRDSGMRVLGCSFQGGAAQVLGTGAALDRSWTLTTMLRMCDATQGQVLDDAVVILDEAGMADTRQFSRLASWCARADVKLVAVGDPDQVHEVGAGGGFRHLVDTLGERVVTLADNVRQLDRSDRRRLKMIQAGEAAQAIESATAAGRWNTAETADGVRSLLLQRWRADPGMAGRDKLIIANTVAEVEWFNQAARKLALGEGLLGPDALTVALSAPDRAVDTRELRVGDRVRSNRNRANAGVYTGRIGTVTEVHSRSRQVVVAFDAHTDRQGRQLPPTRAVLGADFVEEKTIRNSFGRIRHVAPGLTHAYATTASGVQGRTCENAYVLVATAGQHRAAAFVAWSRARQQTQLFGLTVPDPDDLSPHERDELHPEPDPTDVTELAQAMSRESHQTMASVTDPLAAPVGPLLSRPTAWLRAERASLAATLGTDVPPLAEAQRQVRTALADAYGLPLAELECHQLGDAVATALAVLGATVDRLVGHILQRGGLGVRELESAQDPMAVLVWAAGDYATARLTESAERHAAEDHRPETAKATETLLRQRLSIVDTAIHRQSAGRLALAETDPGHYVTAVLGPLPLHGAGAVAWRRAARCIVEYRDAAGRFDTDAPHAQDPWVRALGPVLDDGPLRTHHDQVVGIVTECRVDITLAQLEAHVPPLGERPTQSVAELAERRLGWLDAQLSGFREVVSAGPELERIAEGDARLYRQLREEISDAHARLARAEQGVADADLGPWRPRKSAAVRAAAEDLAEAHQAVIRAEAAAQAQQDRSATSARRLGISQVVPIEHLRQLEQAIDVRSGRLGAELLTHPAAWMRVDIAERLEALDNANLSFVPSRLAAGYRAVALAADRVGLDAHDLNRDQVRELAADRPGIHVGEPLGALGWDRLGPPHPTMAPSGGEVGVSLGR